MPNLQLPEKAKRRAPAAGNERSEFRVITVVQSSKHSDSALDHALEETFPASDPVSITISEVVRVKSTPDIGQQND